MSRLVTREELRIADALVAERPAAVSSPVDRTFELPPGLLLGYFGLILAYLGVMAVGFPSPGMVLPMAIFVTFIVAAVAVPTAWVKMGPDNARKALSLDQLEQRGIMTHTGPCSAGAASIQVLLLPALIFCWGLAAVTIAALV